MVIDNSLSQKWSSVLGTCTNLWTWHRGSADVQAYTWKQNKKKKSLDKITWTLQLTTEPLSALTYINISANAFVSYCLPHSSSSLTVNTLEFHLLEFNSSIPFSAFTYFNFTQPLHLSYNFNLLQHFGFDHLCCHFNYSQFLSANAVPNTNFYLVYPVKFYRYPI